jgi:hypothetical protein
MSGLSELLTDIAAEAKTYGGTEKAVRVLRRRRKVRRLAPLAAVLVVLAGLGLTYIYPLTNIQPKPRTVVPQESIATGSVPWLPTELTAPSTPPPPLPTDRGVGAGSLIYRANSTVHVTPAPTSSIPANILVTTSGAQYRLPAGTRPYGTQASLSPDGTQLLLADHDGTLTVRDLTGFAALEVGTLPAPGDDHRFQAFWSGDSSRLAFPQGSKIIVVTVATGHQTVLHLPAGKNTELCGVRASGEVLVCSQDTVPFQAGVFVLDGQTSAITTQRVVNLKSQLTAAEQQGDQTAASIYHTVFPLADGNSFLVRLNPYDSVDRVTNGGDLLLVDIATGNIRRLPLPEQKIGDHRPQSGGIAFAAIDSREVSSALADGVYLVHTGPLGPSGDDEYQYAVHSIEQLNPATGTRVQVTAVSGVGWVAVRGTPFQS